jgi:hypothetical protein
MNWQFHNYWGLNSATRAYGINESVDQQNGAIFSFAERHQLNLPFTNFFEAKSEIRKPFFERTKGKYLLKELEAGNYGQLIVTRFELLGKTPLQIKTTIGTFTEHEVVLHILDLAGMEFSIGSQVGKMIEHLIDWAAAVEEKYVREDLRHTESIQNAIDSKFTSRQLSGETPYGFRAVENGQITAKGVKIRELVDEPEEQKWILHMAELLAQGKTYYYIAKDMSARGISTKKAGTVQKVCIAVESGKPQTDTRIIRNKWTPGKVQKILESKTIQRWLATRTGGAS